ncbi:hypothetical protein NN3_46350 [Nocardia neocaledoniensis NBRC 108232]|nr:hypothetical protein NN3_46350 [Nocardia neocaledoniensis NBRC 108232]
MVFSQVGGGYSGSIRCLLCFTLDDARDEACRRYKPQLDRFISTTLVGWVCGLTYRLLLRRTHPCSAQPPVSGSGETGPRLAGETPRGGKGRVSVPLPLSTHYVNEAGGQLET